MRPMEVAFHRTRISKILDDLTDPDIGITKSEYAEFLESLLSELECRLEAVEEEISSNA